MIYILRYLYPVISVGVLFHYNIYGYSTEVIFVGLALVLSLFINAGLVGAKDFGYFGFIFVLVVMALAGIIFADQIYDNLYRYSLSWIIYCVLFYLLVSRASGVIADKVVVVYRLFLYLCYMYIVILLLEYGFSYDIRKESHSLFPGGINLFLYGVFVLQVVSFPEKVQKKLQFADMIVHLMLYVLMSAVLGSRQYLVGGFFAFIFLIGRMVSIDRKKSFFLVGVFLMFFLLFWQLDIYEFVDELVLARIDNTERQFYEGYERIYNAEKMINYLFSNNSILGKGAGFAVYYINFATDSSVLEFLMDYGVLIVIMFYLVLVYILISRIKVFDLKSYVYGRIWLVLFFTVFWFGVFNELIREPFFIYLVAVAVSSKIYVNKSHLLGVYQI